MIPPTTALQPKLLLFKCQSVLMFSSRVLQEIATNGVGNNILASPQDDQRRSDHAVLITGIHCAIHITSR